MKLVLVFGSRCILRYKVIYCLIFPQIVEEANLFNAENIRMGRMASRVGSQTKPRRAVRQNGQQFHRGCLTAVWAWCPVAVCWGWEE